MLVEVGDLVGASQAESALLQDEPAIMFMNYLNSMMKVVGTLGNHELERAFLNSCGGYAGGASVNGPFLQDPWRGAEFPVINANMIDSNTGLPPFYPYSIQTIPGVDVPIDFIRHSAQRNPRAWLRPPKAGHEFIDEAMAVIIMYQCSGRHGKSCLCVLLYMATARRRTAVGTAAQTRPVFVISIDLV